MKTTRTFTMNGNTYTSMMDIARELGVKKVYPRDFDKYGIVETTETTGQDTQVAADDTVKADDNTQAQVVDTTDTTVAATADVQVDDTVQAQQDDTQADSIGDDDQQTDTQADVANDQKQDDKVDEADTKAEDKADDKKDEPKVDKRFTRKLGTPEQIKEAQENAGKMDIISFNNYIKHFTVDALVALADAAGVKNWDSITNEPIRKMRLLMEIKAFYYPQDKTPVKPNSEWRKVALADLLALAKKHKLDYKKSDDEKIQRMWVIMAIKAANLTPQDLPQKKDSKADKADSKQVAANA